MFPEIYISKEAALPSNSQWENRFHIKSASSNRLYTIAQHIKGRYWGCDCPGWKRHRKCKHLSEIGLPSLLVPHEVNIITR
ncbi:hypothetical protein K1Y79_04050 [Chitinophaga sp. B61]|uniref:SWIM-type domain-containing protein n=1 Tax=Chitinophaga rhizophila TaxID=2866212 RepID=A0ABS7G774_9BACT|nr:hypothetical protein [Chitinophaga rhizophila]